MIAANSPVPNSGRKPPRAACRKDLRLVVAAVTAMAVVSLGMLAVSSRIVNGGEDSLQDRSNLSDDSVVDSLKRSDPVVFSLRRSLTPCDDRMIVLVKQVLDQPDLRQSGADQLVKLRIDENKAESESKNPKLERDQLSEKPEFGPLHNEATNLTNRLGAMIEQAESLRAADDFARLKPRLRQAASRAGVGAAM
jgi:hypothetical protein